MVGHTGVVTKAVIPCGGSGGRLTPVTNGEFLKIHLDVRGKPLIAHQLRQMNEVGVTEVKLLFRNEGQVGEFLLFKEKYPALDYLPVVDRFPMRHDKNRHLLGLLFQEEISDWRGNRPAVYSLGDNFFKKGALRRAVRIFDERKASVFVSEEFRGGINASPAGTVYSIQKAIEKNNSDNYSPAFAAFILTSEMANFIMEEALNGARSLFPIIKKAFENGIFSVLAHECVWNVNWKADYRRLVEAVERHRYPAYEPRAKT